MRRWSCWIVAAACCCLAGCRQPAPEPEVAAPAPEPPAPVAEPTPKLRFAVYGDCRSRPDKHREVVAQMVQFAPQFTIQTGDLVGDGYDEAEWTQAYDIIAPLRQLGPYHMALGNHDRGNPDFATQLDLPVANPTDTWYSFVEGGVRFYILNTNTIRLPDEAADQMAWFEAALDAATEPLQIVVEHHPCYTIGEYAPGDLTVRKRLEPLLIKHRITAVFSGHDHGYYRTVRDGVPYIVAAGGGAPLYDQDASLAQPGDVYKQTLHFVGIEQTEAGLECRAIDETGAEFDRFTLPLVTATEPEPAGASAQP